MLLRKLGSLAVHRGLAQAPSFPGSLVSLSHFSSSFSAFSDSAPGLLEQEVLSNQGATCTEEINKLVGASGQGLPHPLPCWPQALTAISEAKD